MRLLLNALNLIDLRVFLRHDGQGITMSAKCADSRVFIDVAVNGDLQLGAVFTTPEQRTSGIIPEIPKKELFHIMEQLSIINDYQPKPIVVDSDNGPYATITAKGIALWRINVGGHWLWSLPNKSTNDPSDH